MVLLKARPTTLAPRSRCPTAKYDTCSHPGLKLALAVAKAMQARTPAAANASDHCILSPRRVLARQMLRLQACASVNASLRRVVVASMLPQSAQVSHEHVVETHNSGEGQGA